LNGPVFGVQVIASTQITDASVKDLEELKDLQMLMIMGTKITADGLKELKQALPKADITWKLEFHGPG